MSRHSSLTKNIAVLNGRAYRLAIAVSDYNPMITRALLNECLAALSEFGVRATRIRIIHVPGAFELPLAVMKLASTKKYNSVIALGCILKGDTQHDQYISQETARGLGEAALKTGVPVIFGVLTPNTLAQARARSRKGPLSKGREAALTALIMARLFSRGSF